MKHSLQKPLKEEIVLAVLEGLIKHDDNLWDTLLELTLTIQNHWEGWEKCMEDTIDWIVKVLLAGE